MAIYLNSTNDIYILTFETINVQYWINWNGKKIKQNYNYKLSVIVYLKSPKQKEILILYIFGIIFYPKVLASISTCDH